MLKQIDVLFHEPPARPRNGGIGTDRAFPAQYTPA